MGEIYAEEEYGIKDYIKAIQWYFKAAINGTPETRLQLGKKFISGSGLPKDEIEGLAWLYVSAESGNAESKKYIRELEQRLKANRIEMARHRQKEILGKIGLKGE